MSRGLDSAQVTASQASHRIAVPLVELNFRSGTLRLTLAPWTITEGANTWLSNGNLLRIRDARESATSIEGLEMSLSGVDPAILTLAQPPEYRRRICRLLKGYINPDDYTQLIGSPVPWFIGRMQRINIEELNNSCRVDLIAEHFEAALDRPIPSRLNDADQQRFYSGDLGAQYVEKMAEVKLSWPEKQLLIRQSK